MGGKLFVLILLLLSVVKVWTVQSRSISTTNMICYDLLLWFVKHFERLVDDSRYQELRVEFKASQSSSSLSSPIEILKHVTSIYTPIVLKWFQNELCKSHGSVLIFNGEVGSVRKYEIIPHRKNWHHTITFDSIDNIVLCSYKKYDFTGILCAHALKVLSTRNITSISTQYILERWTKNIKSRSARVTLNISSKDDPKANIVWRYKELCQLHIQLAIWAAESPKAYEIAFKTEQDIGRDWCMFEGESNSTTNSSECIWAVRLYALMIMSFKLEESKLRK